MDWIIALCAVAILAGLLPWATVASKKSAGGKGRLAGATMMIGLLFSAIVDPAKAATTDPAGPPLQIAAHGR